MKPALSDSAHTDQAERCFAHLRRMVSGQHHFVTARYLHRYTTEAAWKEDHRRLPNGMAFAQTIRLTTISPVSRTWKGYWQRAKMA